MLGSLRSIRDGNNELDGKRNGCENSAHDSEQRVTLAIGERELPISRQERSPNRESDQPALRRTRRATIGPFSESTLTEGAWLGEAGKALSDESVRREQNANELAGGSPDTRGEGYEQLGKMASCLTDRA